MAFILDEELQNITNIKVIGVGGGGGNAVNRMVQSGLRGVEFISMNTDQQALFASKATQKVQLGAKLTKDAARAPTEIGQRSAEESRDEIATALKAAQMAFSPPVWRRHGTAPRLWWPKWPRSLAFLPWASSRSPLPLKASAK